jgi:hypothetical protein
MTTALEGGEGSASHPRRCLPPGKTRCPLYRRLGGPQGQSGQVRKISPPTGIRSPDRQARSQPGPHTVLDLRVNCLFVVDECEGRKSEKRCTTTRYSRICFWQHSRRLLILEILVWNLSPNTGYPVNCGIITKY